MMQKANNTITAKEAKKLLHEGNALTNCTVIGVLKIGDGSEWSKEIIIDRSAGRRSLRRAIH